MTALLHDSQLLKAAAAEAIIMETIIDIGLVKEQLRLLGHEVADDVILEFVKGLNRGPAGKHGCMHCNA